MQLTDLMEVKSYLEIPYGNKNEDKALGFFITSASQWIQEWLNRDLEKKSRTEFYRGTGTQELCLKARPVFLEPTIRVFEDETAYYGTPSTSFAANTELTYGQDFSIQVDDGTAESRSGILIKIDGFWDRPQIRTGGLLSPSIGKAFGTIKVIYTAGFTVDTLPEPIRTATIMLVAKMRHMFALGGLEVGSESYEERSVSYLSEKKGYLYSTVKSLIISHRNWYF
jgi:hypothetical protein